MQKLDANKDESVYERMFALEKENECLRNKNKKLKSCYQNCLLKTATKTQVLGIPYRRKRALLTAKLRFATRDNNFIEVNEDKEINDNATMENNPPKS